MTDLRTHLQTTLGDDYTLERELRGGGVATVYIAHDLRHERDVVLTVPPRRE